MACICIMGLHCHYFKSFDVLERVLSLGSALSYAID